MRHRHSTRFLLAIGMIALLQACGGGSSSATGTPAPAPVPTPNRITVDRVQLAQTHLIPASGSSWVLNNKTLTLKLAGGRSALFMADLGNQAPAAPALEGLLNGVLLGEVSLSVPSALPRSAAGDAPYGERLHSAIVPAGWVQPGLQLRVKAAGWASSNPVQPLVGLDASLNLVTLPFYLFGANDSNSPPLSQTGSIGDAVHADLMTMWPVAALNARPHDAGRVSWPQIVVSPREGAPAYVLSNKDQQKEGYAAMSAVLGLLGRLRSANGEGPTNTLYYAPLMMLDASGTYRGPGGGLGGGSSGTGDASYTGVFIHETGHALGLGHAADDYTAGTFPYAGGSLKGSAWGYDMNRNELVAPWLPATSSLALNCATNPKRQMDELGHCFKQDNMQSGAGDQPAGYRFQMHADANVARIQQDYLEGVASLNSSGATVYSGGRLFRDPASPTGYSRWNSLEQKRVPASSATTDNGLYGLDAGLPQQFDVPVHAIALTLSNAGTPGVSQIYPPISYRGNLLRSLDPTDPTQLAQAMLDTGPNAWYCKGSGCDYTLRVTYADGSLHHQILQGAFRPWFKPNDPPLADTKDPLNGSSFKLWVVHVPGAKALHRMELLETPTVWKGMPASPKVVLQR